MSTPTHVPGNLLAPVGQAQPAWEVARLLPTQGQWSESDYLWLTDRTKSLVELTDGYIEVLPMPTEEHQRIVLFLYRALYSFLASRGMGLVLVAPLRLLLQTGRFREPDLLLLLSQDDPRRSNPYWTGADLVAEVVSPDDPQRDLVQKRQEYAAAGIPEYWIVNPADEQIMVLRLQGTEYVEHSVGARGSQVTSALLAGFAVNVADALDAV
ncbi:Uma2 family endonuclease [Candidatus Entotheonella palauensis]|nr:Uma2 family endonuclease [Candidatus Entotheonella palauensis]